MHGRIDAFHGEVGTLDEAHLDRGPALRQASGCPGVQALHRAEGIRKIGLQHDPRLELQQLRLVEDALEDRDGQVEILVFLHVEVDELRSRGGCCGFEQRREPVHDLVDGLVERPHGELADHRGHLDRDVVDVVAGEQHFGAFEPAGGLALAEHGLAEQVEVEAGTASAQLRDGRAETGRRGVHDEVTHHPAQHPARDRHNNARQDRPEDAAQPDGEAHVPGQEAWGLPGDRAQVPARNVQVVRAHDPVDEADGEVEPGRVFQHSGQKLRCRVRRRLRPVVHPARRECDGTVREVGEVVVKHCDVVGSHDSSTLSGVCRISSVCGTLVIR